jgi:hypothetical protein
LTLAAAVRSKICTLYTHPPRQEYGCCYYRQHYDKMARLHCDTLS